MRDPATMPTRRCQHKNCASHGAVLAFKGNSDLARLLRQRAPCSIPARTREDRPTRRKDTLGTRASGGRMKKPHEFSLGPDFVARHTRPEPSIVVLASSIAASAVTVACGHSHILNVLPVAKAFISCPTVGSWKTSAEVLLPPQKSCSPCTPAWSWAPAFIHTS
jgi:hypothetical protein